MTGIRRHLAGATATLLSCFTLGMALAPLALCCDTAVAATAAECEHHPAVGHSTDEADPSQALLDALCHGADFAFASLLGFVGLPGAGGVLTSQLVFGEPVRLAAVSAPAAPVRHLDHPPQL